MQFLLTDENTTRIASVAQKTATRYAPKQRFTDALQRHYKSH